MQPCEAESWQYEALMSLRTVLDTLRLQYDPLPTRLAGRRWFKFNQRTSSERVNRRLKDEFGGQTVRVGGAGNVMAHLMFGVIAIAALGIGGRLC